MCLHTPQKVVSCTPACRSLYISFANVLNVVLFQRAKTFLNTFSNLALHSHHIEVHFIQRRGARGGIVVVKFTKYMKLHAN